MTPEADAKPEPDAIYEAVKDFVSGRLPGRPNLFVNKDWSARGDDPVVVAHFADGFFRLAPADVIRRQQAEILDRLAPPATPRRRDQDSGARRDAVSQETLDRYASKLLELMRDDKDDPTQETLAEEMSVTSRQVRKVGWDRIKARAAELAGHGGSA
jgi:hypothetical protein